jgi:K+-sensing histidine kinase KdpD
MTISTNLSKRRSWQPASGLSRAVQHRAPLLLAHPGYSSADSVQVRAFEDQQGLVVEIADGGPGIPESELPHIWEDLYRGELARGLPGSGFGLAPMRAIIERHDGTSQYGVGLSRGRLSL